MFLILNWKLKKYIVDIINKNYVKIPLLLSSLNVGFSSFFNRSLIYETTVIIIRNGTLKEIRNKRNYGTIDISEPSDKFVEHNLNNTHL